MNHDMFMKKIAVKNEPTSGIYLRPAGSPALVDNRIEKGDNDFQNRLHRRGRFILKTFAANEKNE